MIMLDLLFIVPALPYAAALLLVLAGSRMPRFAAAVLGAGAVGVSAAISVAICASFVTHPPPDWHYTQHLWTWWQAGGFHPAIAFYLDAVSLVWMMVITGVGFLIIFYSTEFMAEDEDYSRFFAYMNLFVGSMLVLVLADNLVLLYLGWEGVGLCSYLLIGFWYRDPANGYAARKAFVVTRVGDTAMAIGLFLLFTQLGTLQIQDLMHRAQAVWPAGSFYPTAAALLLLGGAVGKSAQFPLQTWLPDAMAGPTPVSALIHAATMVTAGVYLIARTHVLFALSPAVMILVAAIGALTLLLAGFAALAQIDIKRVLAYSTISQIGYMFLALGVGAWSAAVFHFMIHAFFKALLFLGAGSIIHCLDHEHNMFKMGGLRRQLPVTFWTFLAGSGALAAVPLVTAGFYSKDQIIWNALSSPQGSVWFWLAAIFGAFLTSLYTFRMVVLTFFGEAKTRISRRPGIIMKIPLIVLALLSIIGGFIQLPPMLGNFPLLADFLQNSLPRTLAASAWEGYEAWFAILSALISLGGIFIVFVFIMGLPRIASQIARSQIGTLWRELWFAGWGFDWIYDRLLVRPYVYFSRINRADAVDFIYRAMARVSVDGFTGLSLTQSGRMRHYAFGIAAGAVLIVGMAVFL